MDRALPPGLRKEGREKGCVGVAGKGEFLGKRVFLLVVCGGWGWGIGREREHPDPISPQGRPKGGKQSL